DYEGVSSGLAQPCLLDIQPLCVFALQRQIPGQIVNTMPVHSYGVWVGKPIRYETDGEADASPHINLIFKDDLLGSREHTAAINVKSDGPDSRLVYWRINSFTHPITSTLEPLDYGFYRLPIRGVVRGLDFTRGTPILDIRTGRILPHDLPGGNNDILDVVEPVLDSAISQNAKVYMFGSSFGSGIHDVHMNQGSRRMTEATHTPIARLWQKYLSLMAAIATMAEMTEMAEMAEMAYMLETKAPL
ncbi:hypothetical protein BGW39_008729, partial [Mortierella sp. 14UC]